VILMLGYFGAILMGVSLGIMGAGGSILTVPVFVYLFKIPAALATGLSLFVVGTVSAAGTWGYVQRHQVKLKTALLFSLPAVGTVFWCRRVLVPGLPDILFKYQEIILSKNTFIMVLFALVMVVAAIGMIRPPKKGQPKSCDSSAKSPIPFLKVMVLGALVGLVSGLVGAGGGFLIVPSLVLLANLEMKSAVGTSLLVIAINSGVGFFGEMQQGTEIPWNFLLVFTGLAMAGMFLGSLFSKKISGNTLKPAFGWFVLVMSAVILVQEIFKAT